MFAHLTAEQFEFLASLSRGSAPVRLEPLSACQAEDRRRSDALLKLKRKIWAGIPECDPRELANLLDYTADPNRSQPSPPCLASAVYLRHRRRGVLGAIVDLVRQHRHLDVAWLTASDPLWRFDPKQACAAVVPQSQERLKQQLELYGAAAAPGFLLAFVNGCFDPRTQQFHLQYRGIVGGEKLKCIHKATTSHAGLHDTIKIALYRTENLPLQITRMLRNSPRELSFANDATILQRMSEPHHSVYLLWLSQHTLADICVATGVLYYNGRLALRECYGRPGSSSLSPVPVAALSRPSRRDSSPAGAVATLHRSPQHPTGHSGDGGSQEVDSQARARRAAKSTTKGLIQPNRVLPGI